MDKITHMGKTTWIMKFKLIDFTFLSYPYRCSNLPPCLEIWDVENKPFLVCWMQSEGIVNLEMSQHV